MIIRPSKGMLWCSQEKSHFHAIFSNIEKYSWHHVKYKSKRILYICIILSLFIYAIYTWMHAQNCVMSLFENRAIPPKQCKNAKELARTGMRKETVIGTQGHAKQTGLSSLSLQWGVFLPQQCGHGVSGWALGSIHAGLLYKKTYNTTNPTMSGT